jgi:hypothetical protein
MRSWMRYSMYIISLILVALILLPSLAVGKPPEDKGKDKDNGKPPKTEDKDNGKPPKTEDEDKNNGKPPKTKDEVKFVIITSSSGPNGNVSPSGSVKVKIGDDQRFKVSANGGYRIEEVVVDGNKVFSCDSEGNEHVRKLEHSFEDVQETHDISAKFARDVFTIKALARGPGTISPPGAVKVRYGDSQDFSIRATQGFCIDDVQISPSDDKNTLDMDAAKGASTYTFSLDGVKSDYTIIVTFARLKEPEPDPETDPEPLTIESKAEGAGSIDPLGEVEVEYGSDQTFTMTPEQCHRISAVLVDDELVVEGLYIDEETGIGTYTFTDVKEDHTINAIFEEITYTIMASAGSEGEGGSIDPSGEVEVVCGSEQTFTITPGPCYSIAEVLVGDPPVAVAVDAVDIDEETGIGTYTFTNVSSDDAIYATFEEITEPYIIKASAGDGGTIDPSGEVEVACGSEQTFTIIPNESCYGIAEVKVDGEEVDVEIDAEAGTGTYTFTDVSSDHTIQVTFEKITYTIKATAGEHGSIIPSGEVQVECGGSQLFKIKPDEGYTRGSVLVDGSPVNTKGNKYEFTGVDADHTIEVTFVIEPDEEDLIGDANNDGEVNSGDAIFILLIVTGQIEPTEQQELAADVNGDGVIDVNDALFVLNIVAGLAAPDANFDSALLQNFPNPFNPETWIPFRLSEGSEVTIEIYDATGHLVRRLPLGHKPAGFYTSQERAAYWDGCNEHGERVASGVYFYAIRAADFADMKKMIIAQ